MRFFEDLSFNDIGRVLGIKPNTANARCVRALLKIKQYLPDRDG
jgi:DNA-directed RNA polymerase specialized sigma24 family protein